MNWTRQELSALVGLRGPGVEIVLGASDEGDPWCVVYQTNNNRALAHFARIDGFYVGYWAAGLAHFRSGCLRSIVDEFFAGLL